MGMSLRGLVCLESLEKEGRKVGILGDGRIGERQDGGGGWEWAGGAGWRE